MAATKQLATTKREARLAAAWLKAVPPHFGAMFMANPQFYWRGVEYVALVLRPRFESGELRGWMDEDEDACSILLPKKDRITPPPWRVEQACRKHFLTTPEACLLVIRSAPPRTCRDAWSWSWATHATGNTCLLGVAEELMAIDVLEYARAAGWSRPKRGEERFPKARGARQRASVAHGRAERVA